MDPDANLNEQRSLSELINQGADNERMVEWATRLSDLVYELDQWIKRGGHLPKDWRQ